MADIFEDKWYKEMKANIQADIEVVADPPRLHIKRTSSPQRMKPSPNLAQMQADSMARLRKRAMPPIKREYL